jgi:CO dehydrogenase/acetyl-CoA synthase epsilon subunit
VTGNDIYITVVFIGFIGNSYSRILASLLQKNTGTKRISVFEAYKAIRRIRCAQKKNTQHNFNDFANFNRGFGCNGHG